MISSTYSGTTYPLGVKGKIYVFVECRDDDNRSALIFGLRFVELFLTRMICIPAFVNRKMFCAEKERDTAGTCRLQQNRFFGNVTIMNILSR